MSAWTSTPPTKEGYYWMRQFLTPKDRVQTLLVRTEWVYPDPVTECEPRMFFFTTDEREGVVGTQASNGILWQGPIKPEEAQE